MSLISVIVPVYKVEKYLKRCVDSILTQTYTDLEVILVDDGSPDKCGELCDIYASEDSRVHVIHKSNGGLSDARNAGIKIAKGEYLTFVDSDDCIHKSMFEWLYKTLKENGCDIAIGGFQKFSEEKEIVNEFSIPKPEVLNNLEALNCLYGKHSVAFITAWGKLYHKSLFNEVRYPKGKIHEDEFVIHRLLYAAKRVAFINLPLYFYFQNESGIMNSGFSEKSFAAFEALEERMDFFVQRNLYELNDKTLIYSLDLLQAKYKKLDSKQAKHETYKKLMRSMYKKWYIKLKKAANISQDKKEYYEYFLYPRRVRMRSRFRNQLGRFLRKK